MGVSTNTDASKGDKRGEFSKPVEPTRLDWYIDWIEDTVPGNTL
jgi:hypothetical protein